MSALAAPLAAQAKETKTAICFGPAVDERAKFGAESQDLPRYYDEETRIKQLEVDANTAFTNDKLRCKGLLGQSANACLKKAGRKDRKSVV